MDRLFGYQFLRKVRGRLRIIRNRGISLVASRHRSDLVRVGGLFGTDKWGSHQFLRHYETHFQALREEPLNLLEIGVGGYDHPYVGGESLRTWKAYFPKANIFGIDIYDKRKLEEERIKTFQGSQTDAVFLRNVVQQIGEVDIIIDDGSHVNEHVIETFEILFPLLKNPGIYVIEDTQTSYWPGYGGSSREINLPRTIMGYFTRLVHSLNYEEILRPGYTPTYFDRHIVAMHFYHNLIFVHKGDNAEGSNIIRNNATDAEFVLGTMQNPSPVAQDGPSGKNATEPARGRE